jgi:preprotein translocase SecF subunit
VLLCDPFPTVATIGPVVASNLQGKAIVAIFISMLGVIFYMGLRFDFNFGVAAIVATVHDILITIGVYSVTDMLVGHIWPLKFNLPEVAAILTIIGYSINDTIVVFDRIRENLHLYGRKKTPLIETVNLSINQTLSRTLLTGVMTFETVMALLLFGGDAIRGFAYIFLIGLITGTFSSIFVASPVLVWLEKRSEVRRAAQLAAAEA